MCGAVTYSCASEPTMTAVCHCTVCQNQSGAPFSVNIGVMREDLAIAGEPSTYVTVGEDSGAEVERKFCGNCGSPIVSLIANMPDFAFIKAGTLEDTSWVEPEIDVFCDSKQPWVQIAEERGQFPRGLDLE